MSEYKYTSHAPNWSETIKVSMIWYAMIKAFRLRLQIADMSVRQIMIRRYIKTLKRMLCNTQNETYHDLAILTNDQLAEMKFNAIKEALRNK
jgi:hypothetical protein